MGGYNEQASTPRSMRQQQILEVAADRPDASVETIADEVTTATPELVEEVLVEYGDPAEPSEAPPTAPATTASAAGAPDGATQTKTDGGSTNEVPGPTSAGPDPFETPGTESATTESDETGNSDEDPAAVDLSDSATSGDSTATVNPSNTDPVSLDPAELTPARRETLRVIRDNPDASQRALAEKLGVTAPTVSQRVNSISGFEWENRVEFSEAVLDSETDHQERDTMTPDDAATNAEPTAETVAELERKIDTLAAAQSGGGQLAEPELIAKVIHACMDAETISREEEIQIIRTLVT